MEKISWVTEEYEHKDKTPDWYWALGIIAIAGAAISIIYKNYLFAIFIILAAIILAMYSSRKPEPMNIEISEKGVRIKNEIYPYSMIKSFWIESLPNESHLLLHTKRILMPIIVLNIENNLESKIQQMLSSHTKEEEMKEPVTQRVMEHLGF